MDGEPRMRRWWRAFAAPAGRIPRILIAVACGLVLVMYCTNHDMGGDDDSPRGDGKYRPVLARGDGHLLYLMARSTVLDGDWDFDNDLARFGDIWGAPRTATGRKGIVHPIGPALVWAPVLAFAHVTSKVANLFGADIASHGYTPWHQRIVFFTSVVFACGAALLGRRAAQRAVGGAWAPTYAAIAVLLGTSLTYYATHMPSYSHAMDAFSAGALLAYWIATLGRRDVKRHVVLGVLLGVAALVRTQSLALGIVVAVEIAADLIDLLRGRSFRAAGVRIALGALVLAVAIVVMLPQFLEWRIVYGQWIGLPQGPKFTRFGSPLVLETLFSSRNGWLSTTPIAYLGVIGLACLPRRSRLVAIGLVAAVVLQVYLASTIFDWWAGASHGQRRLCNLTLPLVVGLAALIWRVGRLAMRVRRIPPRAWHAAVVVVLGPLVAWNLRVVFELRGGKPANSGIAPSCCERVPGPLRGVAQVIYGAIGNPFEFPANAIFAVAHDVPLARWDVAVGDYALVPPLNALVDGTLDKITGVWRIGHGGGMDVYVVGGLSPSYKAERPFRWTIEPTAHVLVPNLMPDGQRMKLWLQPGGASHVRLRWDGDVVADADLPAGWSTVTFDVPSPGVGTDELAIESTPAVVTTALPGADRPVGVAVGTLELQFLP